MRLNTYFKYGIIWGVMLCALQAHSQFYTGSQQTFGKNRVQYKDFYWSLQRYDRFDTYFYPASKNLAQYAANYTGKYLEEFENFFEYQLDDKIQFIVFAKYSDRKQSNIGLGNEDSYNTGGITQIIDNKIMLYGTGNFVDLEEQIRSGIAHIIIQKMIYGTSITTQIKNNTIYSIPNWYLEGLSNYFGRDWSLELDNKLRDLITSGTIKNFYSLLNINETLAGRALWKFIADVYGKESIPKIVFLNKLHYGADESIERVLGRPYKEVLNQFLEYYTNLYKEVGTYPANEEFVIKQQKRKNQLLQTVRMSPDNENVAYVTNELGRVKVRIQNVATGKSKTIYRKGIKFPDHMDLSQPVITWHPNGDILAMALEDGKNTLLCLYTISEKRWDKYILSYFDKVLDMSYSDNGQHIVMSAVQNGQSDILVYSVAARSHFQVTNDAFDDLNPRFIDKSQKIIFSSNRNTESTHPDKNLYALSSNHDIFIYDFARKNPQLFRLTNTPNVDESNPVEYKKGQYAYLSSGNGIQNRCIASIDSVISQVDTAVHYRYFANTKIVSNYNTNILWQDMDAGSPNYIETLLKNRKYHIYINPKSAIENQDEITLQNTTYGSYLLQHGDGIVENKDTDTVSESTTPVRKRRLVNVYMQDEPKPAENTNTENHVTSGKLADNIPYAENYLPNIQSISGQESYLTQYYYREITTQVDFSFLDANYQAFSGFGNPIYLNPGFNALFKLSVNDIFEDYRITGGVRFAFDLDNYEFLLSFQNMKHRLDQQWVLHRQSIKNYTNYYISKTTTHNVFYILKYPFNEYLCIKGTLSARYDQETFLSTDIINLQEPNVDNLWGIGKAEFIYDATRYLGTNLYTGTRFKLFGEFYQSVLSENKNMFVFGGDFRWYQKIGKCAVWANRMAFSGSLGNNHLLYYMGGEDNWLFPKFNTNVGLDTSYNYAYQTLATNMRGFYQNIRNGNNFALISTELRLPVFRMIMQQKLRSNFLYNFQMVGFCDVGTAWSHASPWDKENTMFYQVINGNPITVILDRENNPLVAGFGLGARARLFGYFIRLDYAWGVENGIINKGVFYLSLSLDF